MKKILFALTLFLFFIISIPVKACRNYDTTNGLCLDQLIGNIYDYREYEETGTQPETQQPAAFGETAAQTTDVVKNFFNLTVQFFGIVILFIFLIVLLEEIVNK